jgi:hypothetical protein
MGALALSIVAAAVASSLIDWLFAGVLFHDKYLAYPEIWRNPRGGSGESRAVGLSASVAVLTPVVFVLLCRHLAVRPVDAFALAGAIWLIGPLPILITQYLFVRMHALVTASHAAGWLAKLLACAAAVAWLL